MRRSVNMLLWVIITEVPQCIISDTERNMPYSIPRTE